MKLKFTRKAYKHPDLLIINKLGCLNAVLFPCEFQFHTKKIKHKSKTYSKMNF